MFKKNLFSFSTKMRFKRLPAIVALAAILISPAVFAQENDANNVPQRNFEFFQSISLRTSAFGWNTKGIHGINGGTTNPKQSNKDDAKRANMDNGQALELRFMSEKFSLADIDNLRTSLKFGYDFTEYDKSQQDIYMFDAGVLLQKDIPLKYLILRPGIGGGAARIDTTRLELIGELEFAIPLGNGNEFAITPAYTMYDGISSTKLQFGLNVPLGDKAYKTTPITPTPDNGIELETKILASFPGVVGKNLSIKQGYGTEFDLLFGKGDLRPGFGIRNVSEESEEWKIFHGGRNQRSLEVPGFKVFMDRQFNLEDVSFNIRPGIVTDYYSRDSTFFPDETGPQSFVLGPSLEGGVKFRVSSAASFGIQTAAEYFPKTRLGVARIGPQLTVRF
jgi:hypothetical protein